MFKHDPTDTKPCPHMRHWVSALADGALTGLARWYTERHVGHCAAVPEGHGDDTRRPGPAAALSPARRRLCRRNAGATIEAAWEQTDRERAQALTC